MTHAQQLQAAGKFVDDNLVELCRDLVSLEMTGLIGNGKLAELRSMCSFATSHALALAQNMVEAEAVRFTATRGDSQ